MGIIDLQELANKATEIIGKKLAKIDKTGRLKTGKGAIGTVIEETWFGYKPNSIAGADFDNLGIELKVTPYTKTIKKDKIVIRAKERLVANIINYMTEYKAESFEESSFYKKCNSLLLMFYEHQLNITKSEFFISNIKFVTLEKARMDGSHIFFLLPRTDISIMKQDWQTIIAKIKNGLAHEISEGDTNYLAACTKGATAATSMVAQPFSDILAKRRAYSLKQSYMSYFLNEYVFNASADDAILRDTNLAKNTFEGIVIEKLKSIIGKTDIELARTYNISTTNKSYRERIIAKGLGLTSTVNDPKNSKKQILL